MIIVWSHFFVKNEAKIETIIIINPRWQCTYLVAEMKYKHFDKKLCLFLHQSRANKSSIGKSKGNPS